MITLKKGFALLEILLVIAIMALLSSIVAPQFRNIVPHYEKILFLNQLNNLLRSAIVRAQKNNTFYTITFNLENNIIVLEQWDEKSKKKIALKDQSMLTRPCTIPPTIECKQIFIEGFDEIGKYAGNKKAAKVWFFIAPSGTTQSVIINMINNKDTTHPTEIGLVLNPFIKEFIVYESFQKP